MTPPHRPRMDLARVPAALLLWVLLLAGAVAPAWASSPVTPDAAALPDIRDIRPPLDPPARRPWGALALGGLALALAGAGTAFAVRRLRRPRALEAWEIAIQRIEKTSELLDPEHAYAFSIAISEAVRTFLEKRFDVPVTHQTTSEFLLGLTQDEAGPLHPHRELLQNFLDHCDRAKYARWEMGLRPMIAMHASARRLVEETRPRPGRRRLAVEASTR